MSAGVAIKIARRTLRREIAAIAVTFAIASLLVAIFPFSAVSFRPTAPKPCAVTAALVTLDEATEKAVLASARAAWETGRADVRQLRVEMFSEPLPPSELKSVMTVADLAAPVPPPLDLHLALEPPSVAAEAPFEIEREADESPLPAFSFEEMVGE